MPEYNNQGDSMGIVIPLPLHQARASSADKSFIDSGTSISADHIKSGMCHLPGIPSRFSHCSTAFTVKPKRSAMALAPPKRAISVGTSVMAKENGTFCSGDQELFVPFSRSAGFRHGDTIRPLPDNRAMTDFMPQNTRAEAAYARFMELAADLAMSEDAAVDYAYEFGVVTKDMTRKAVKQWFARKQIPPYAVFNIADAMGIDVGWLGGFNRISKEKAIRKNGYYFKELERIERIRAEVAAKNPRKRA